MFPIHTRYFRKYYFDDSAYGKFIVAYIEKYLHLIVKETQLYHDNYANGKRYKYCVDINHIIEKLGL